MSRAKAAAGVAYWAAKERATYIEWQRLKRKGASTAPGEKRDRAFKDWNHAHQMRVRRVIQLRRLDASSWRIDDASAKALADREGVIPYAYADSRGFATAWIGHLIRQGPVRAEDYARWGSKAHPADHARILRFFRDVDLVPYEKVVDDAIRARVKSGHGTLSPSQRGAAVSLTFNVGTGGFAGSTVAKLIRSGAPTRQVADAFMAWDRPREILGRRKSERDQYATG